jgi:hypothetical protein
MTGKSGACVLEPAGRIYREREIMDEKLKKRLAEIDGILDAMPTPVKDSAGTLDALGLIIDEIKGYLDGKNPDKEKWVLTDRLLKKIGKIQKKCKKKEIKIPELEDVIVKPKETTAGSLPEPERTIEFMGGSLDVIDASKIKPPKK